jgi:hypothetical protein
MYLQNQRTVTANEKQLKTLMRWWRIHNCQLWQSLGILQHWFQINSMLIECCGWRQQNQQPDKVEFHGDPLLVSMPR